MGDIRIVDREGEKETFLKEGKRNEDKKEENKIENIMRWGKMGTEEYENEERKKVEMTDKFKDCVKNSTEERVKMRDEKEKYEDAGSGFIGGLKYPGAHNGPHKSLTTTYVGS